LTEITPLGTLILVIPDAPEELSGGLVKPDNLREERPESGIVKSTGPLIGDNRILVGSRVVFPPYAGHDYRLDGTLLKLLDASEVYGVVKDEGDPVAAA
jgi:co-chaperonin GroES (HSP10)